MDYIRMNRSPFHYTVHVECLNCRRDEEIEIRKGTPQDDGIRNAKCSNCGIRGYMRYFWDLHKI